MKLTPRLQSVAAQIPPNSVVADIGTDHAYIPVYLVKNRIALKAIASDSRPGPLEAAKTTVQAFNVDKVVNLRLGDGLSVLSKLDQVDVVVIAGMGGETIRTILEQGMGVIGPQTRLVLQPMTEVGLVRRWLVGNGFGIFNEDLVQEGDTFYEVVVALQGAEVDWDQRLLDIGPLLVEKHHPLLKPFLDQRLVRVKKAVANSANSTTPGGKARHLTLVQEQDLLEEVLSWL